VVIRFITSSCKLLIAIYRPPGALPTLFFDELSDLFDAMCSAGGHPILTGDVNCPGTSSNTIDCRLSSWVSCYNLINDNEDPTRINYNGEMRKLDVMTEPEEHKRLTVCSVIPVGF